MVTEEDESLLTSKEVTIAAKPHVPVNTTLTNRYVE